MEHSNQNNINSTDPLSWEEMSTGIMEKLQKKKQRHFWSRLKWIFGTSLFSLMLVAFVIYNPTFLSQEGPYSKATIDTPRIETDELVNTEQISKLETDNNFEVKSIQPNLTDEKETIQKNYQSYNQAKKVKEINSAKVLNKTTNIGLGQNLGFHNKVAKKRISEETLNLFDYNKSFNVTASSKTEKLRSINRLSPNLEYTYSRIITDTLPLPQLQELSIDSLFEKYPSQLSFGVSANALAGHPGIGQMGWGTQLEYNRFFNSKNYIGIGFSYEELNYRFMHNQSTSETAFKLIRVQLDTLNDAELTIYANQTTTTSRRIDYHNKHKLYSIPLFYGRQVNFEKFAFNLESGFLINLRLSSSGLINYPSNELAITEIESGNVFKKSVGMSWLLNIKLRYRLADKWSVYGKLGYAKGLGSWYSDVSYDLNPGYSSFGTGLTFNF